MRRAPRTSATAAAGRWWVGSGAAWTVEIGAVSPENAAIAAVAALPNRQASSRVSVRPRACHAADLRIDRKWKWDSWELSAYLDVTNVYAHARVLGYSFNFDFSQRAPISHLPSFQLPTTIMLWV